MTVQEWVAGFAAKLGTEPPDQATFDTLLEIAAEASHASERIAAPIACYLVGRTGLEPKAALVLAKEVSTTPS